MKNKRTLDKKPPSKKAPFVLDEPNDDIDAYGWALKRLRRPSKDSDGTVWAGRPLFDYPQDLKSMNIYGPEVQFLDPQYLQLMFDKIPEINKAVEKVRAAGYTPAALEKLTKLIVKHFEETVLVDIVQRFFQTAPLIAQFYAARLAHLYTFGPEKDEPGQAQEDQIEAKTTKSRR